MLPRTYIIGRSHPAQSPIPRRPLNPYLLVDVDLVWRSPWDFVIAAHLRNLFDNPFYIIQNYPPPGREWYLEVRLPLL